MLMLINDVPKLPADGHKNISTTMALHVCSPLNIYVPASDSAQDELSDKDKDMVAELIKSGIPTIVLYSGKFHLSEWTQRLGDRLEGYPESDIWVIKYWFVSFTFSPPSHQQTSSLVNPVKV